MSQTTGTMDAPVIAPVALSGAGLLDTGGSALTPKEGWVTVALVLAMNLVVITTVERTPWVDPMPHLAMVSILALGLSMGVMKLRVAWPLQVLAHLAVLGVGLGVALIETAGTLDGSASHKLGETMARLREWTTAISTERISNDKLPFLAIICFSAWLIMCLSAFFTFKLRWAWVAVIPPALGLMTHQTYLPSSTYPVPLFFFLLFGILLMGRTYYLGQEQLRVHGADPRKRRWTVFLPNAILLTIVALLLAWALPTNSAWKWGALHSTFVAARGPWADMEGGFERMFAGVPSQKAGPLHSFGAALPLRGSIALDHTPVMTVTTDYPMYWRGQTYELYEGRGWIAAAQNREPIKSSAMANSKRGGTAYAKQEVVAQQFRLATESDVLFAGGQPIEINLESTLNLTAGREFSISLRQPPLAGSLPTDLHTAALKIVKGRGTAAEIQAALPAGTNVVSTRRDAVTVARNDPATPDVLSVRSPRRLKPEATYQVLSSVSVATATDLRRDKAAYPQWVTDAYLQLPPTLPQRVKDLAVSVTEGKNNAYDKTLAIQQHLRENYQQDLTIQPPPLNVDAVDYFLFTQKAGYSDYFASSMVVLLRAGGVPARLVAGYEPGLFDPDSTSFTVDLSGAHSWPEAFFPTYGWIPFEPLPSLEALNPGPLEIARQIPENNAADVFDNNEDLFDSDDLTDEELAAAMFGPERDPTLTQVFGSIASTVGIVLAIVLGMALIVVLMLSGAWQVNFLGLAYAPSMYARLSKLGNLAWRGPVNAETPVEYAASLATALSLRRDQAESIARGFVKGRYSDQPVSAQDRLAIERAWRGVRRPLLRSLVRRLNVFDLLRSRSEPLA